MGTQAVQSLAFLSTTQSSSRLMHRMALHSNVSVLRPYDSEHVDADVDCHGGALARARMTMIAGMKVGLTGLGFRRRSRCTIRYLGGCRYSGVHS